VKFTGYLYSTKTFIENMISQFMTPLNKVADISLGAISIG